MRRRKKKDKYIFTNNYGESVEFNTKEELEFMEQMSENLGYWTQFFAQMGVDLTRVNILNFYSEIAKVLEYAKNPKPGMKISVVHDSQLGYFTVDIVPIYPGYLN